MVYNQLSSNSHKLLNDLISSEHPEAFLRKKAMESSPENREMLFTALNELKACNIINIIGTNFEPSKVIINISARTYEEPLALTEKQNARNTNNSIVIGNGNTIEKSTFSINNLSDSSKKDFLKEHPIICGIIISVIATFIMMFSFWSQIVSLIEGLFS